MDNIFVARPTLPPLQQYNEYLEKIWRSHQLTNHGPFSQELKHRLEKFLDVKNLCLVTNGTIALQIALKACDLRGKVITSPFSYVATTSSVVWEGLEPVFVDIDENTLNIDPMKIEEKITSETQAILATHVFGNPCDVYAIEKIAKKHSLKVIYDAAHAFNVTVNNKPITNFGDISILSFHSTKVFHTIEGGALIANDDNVYHRTCYMCNFGHNGPESFWGLGINGKIDEFRSAMGLCILDSYDEGVSRRQEIHVLYDNCLFPNNNLRKPVFLNNEISKNYGYYPVIFNDECTLKEVLEDLKKIQIYPRRYFYPCLNELPYVTYQQAPIAESISKRILCLPVFVGLSSSNIEALAAVINKKTS